jgi:hypothetical protein
VLKIMETLDDLMIKWRRYGELTVAAVLLVFFLGARLFIGEFINLQVKKWRFVSPAFWPGWTLLIGAVLAAVLLYGAYRKIKDKQACESPETQENGRYLVEETESSLRGGLLKDGRALSPRELEAPEAASKAQEEQPTSRELVRFVLIVGLSFIYLYLIQIMGFITSTALFGFAYLFLLRERRALVLVITPLAMVAVILVVFTKVLVVSVPRGIGFFRDVSNLFY